MTVTIPTGLEVRIRAGTDDSSGTNYLMAFGDGDGNSVGSITHTGGSTSFNTSSDYRLKENVSDITGAIDRVKALVPKRFNFIKHPDKTVDGFLVARNADGCARSNYRHKR